MIRIGAGIIAVLVVLLGLAFWQIDRQKERISKQRVEIKSLDDTLKAERENTRKANEAAKRYQTRADALEADRRNNPLPPVRVCRSPSSVPKTAATAVPGEAAQADNSGADAGDSDGRDIGPQLDQFATDAELNLIQCQELQRWVLER